MRIEMVVEVPAGSRNKYEVDHTTGTIWLDRQLFTATRYPADYGFGKSTETIGWAGRAAAEREITESRDRYRAGA